MTTRQKYSKAFKLDAVSLVLDQDHTRREAARSLDTNEQMLGRWVKEHQASEDGQAFRGNGKLTLELACRAGFWESAEMAITRTGRGGRASPKTRFTRRCSNGSGTLPRVQVIPTVVVA